MRLKPFGTAFNSNNSWGSSLATRGKLQNLEDESIYFDCSVPIDKVVGRIKSLTQNAVLFMMISAAGLGALENLEILKMMWQRGCLWGGILKWNWH